MSDSPNFLTYAQTAFDPFEERPFCAVDSLVFAWLSYLRLPGDMAELTNWQGLDVRELLRAECYRDMTGDLWDPEGSRALLEAVTASPRYRGMHVCGYRAVSDVVATEQFAAMAFRFPAGFSYLSFRGTDSTIVGWKEDFNMSYLEAVPAQVRAAEYTAEIMRLCRLHKVRIGGHSKGGNLAAWAGLHLPKRDYGRLLAVYNNDGPGFSRSLTELPEFALLKGKLHTYIPESSIVGVLLEHCEEYTVIASTARSIMQHEALSWCTERNHFIHLEERSTMGRRSDDVLRDWIGSMTPQERKDFTDAFFEILSMGGKARTLEDVQEMGLGGAVALVKEYAGADEKTRRILAEIFKRLAVDIGGEVASSAQDGLKHATGFLKNLGRKKPEK